MIISLCNHDTDADFVACERDGLNMTSSLEQHDKNPTSAQQVSIGPASTIRRKKVMFPTRSLHSNSRHAWMKALIPHI